MRICRVFLLFAVFCFCCGLILFLTTKESAPISKIADLVISSAELATQNGSVDYDWQNVIRRSCNEYKAPQTCVFEVKKEIHQRLSKHARKCP